MSKEFWRGLRENFKKAGVTQELEEMLNSYSSSSGVPTEDIKQGLKNFERDGRDLLQNNPTVLTDILNSLLSPMQNNNNVEIILDQNSTVVPTLKDSILLAWKDLKVEEAYTGLPVDIKNQLTEDFALELMEEGVEPLFQPHLDELIGNIFHD